jgi:hypothetical protein
MSPISLRPLALLSLVTTLWPSAACTGPIAPPGHGDDSASTRAQDGGESRGDGSRSAREDITVGIGSRGDGHPLPRGERRWERHPARLVLNAPFQSWTDAGTWVHVVAYTPALEPCEQADFYLDDVHVGRGDPHGAFAFRRTAREGINLLRVACRSRDAKWYRGQLRYTASARRTDFERPVVYIHSDKGVYKPGQVLHVRALAWRLRGEYTAAPEQHVTVALEGPDGQPVGGARIHTDDDGVGTLDIPIPRNLPEGQYKLVATPIDANPPPDSSLGFGNDTRTHAGDRAEAPIQIRRFETPVIQITHTLGEFLTPSMREVPFTVSLSYLDGAPFTNARVQVTLGEGNARVALPQRTLSGAGPHAWTLTEAQLSPFRRTSEVRVEVSATDSTGRRDTVVRMMRVVDNPYRATLELDRNGYAEGETVDVALRVTDLNSVVQRDKPVRLRGCGLERSGRTDDGGVAHFRFPMPRDECSVQAFTEDTRSPIASVHVPRSVVRPMQSRVVEERLREREPFTIQVNFPSGVVPVERVVHGDLTDSSGAIIESFSIPIEIRDGAPRAHTTLRPPSWGSMLVSLYTLGVDRERRRDPTAIGLLTDGQSVAVGAVRHLEVTLHGLEGPLRPGQVIPVRMDIRRDGAPATATLGVSVVHRGVIGMLDPYEHPPFDRFYDPQQKVLASTGAQSLTWPVVQRTWGPDRYDIGWLPSFGMHAGARVEDDPSVQWPDHAPSVDGGSDTGEPSNNPAASASPFAFMTEQGADGAMLGDTIGDAFGYGGFGASGTGWGGGGTGEGTIGLGALGAIGPGRRGMRGLDVGGEQQGTGGRRLIEERTEAPLPLLIVRTGTEDTSLWLPRARGGEGSSPMQLRVPETIGEHQLNVLASDRQGGIALARATLTVRQPLYVRADVPETLTVGDVATVTVVARNSSDAAVDVGLALRAQRWTVEPMDPTRVSIAARGQGTARFRVRATLPGPARYEVEARGPSLVDQLQDQTWVRPAGTATHERVTGSLRAGQPFVARVGRAIPGCVENPSDGGACASSYRVARLSIAMPESTAWDPALDVGTMAADIELAAHGFTTLSQWAERAETSPAREAAESSAAMALFTLRTAESRSRRLSPRVRAHLLEGLARASRMGYPLRASTLAAVRGQVRADASRLAALGDRLLCLRALIETHLGMSPAQAEQQPDDETLVALASERSSLREALAALDAAPDNAPRTFADALALVSTIVRERAHLPGLFAELQGQIVSRRTTDPSALSRDASHHGSFSDESAQTIDRVLHAARTLLQWRRAAIMEPGAVLDVDRVYATAWAVLSMHAVAPDRAAGELREVSEFLRSRRVRWERWFDPEASAAALRGLSLAGTRPEREGAAVVVKVDGREVRRAVIDPRDPWTSALALRQITLEDALGEGDGTVTVEYTGALNPQVTLDVERWSSRAPSGASLQLSAPDRAVRGALLPVRVRATTVDARNAELWVTLPPSSRLEESALDRAVIAGTITDWRSEPGRVRLTLGRGTTAIDLTIPCRVQRPGVYAIGAAELRNGDEIRASITGPTVTVR